MSDTASRQLDAEYFDVMASFARRHWWYLSRRELVRSRLVRHARRDGIAVDVGCGTGEMLEVLASLGYRQVAGTELSSDALDRSVTSGQAVSLMASDAEHLPFRADHVVCMTSMDVVEHLDDDVIALREFARVLAPGATLALTVPAYQWMWSAHDERACHRRRYTAPMLSRAVTAAGFAVLETTYYNSFLVPPAMLLRKTPLRRLVKGTDEEASFVHPVMNRLLGGLAAMERRIGRRVRIPFGLSLLLVARAPG